LDELKFFLKTKENQMGRFVGVVFGSLIGIAVGTAAVAFDETLRTMIRERMRKSSLCSSK